MFWLGCVIDSVVDPAYILSIVGCRARPRSVERKSDGRSKRMANEPKDHKKLLPSVPLIQDGIVPPVRKPTQSLVKELQLKSNWEVNRRWGCNNVQVPNR